MADIIRLRAVLAGSAVPGGGVSTFYTSAASFSGMPGAVKAFYTSLVASCPSSLSVTVPNTADVIDVATGTITGSVTTTGGGTVTMTGGGAYVMGTGARVTWVTTGIVNGRRVRGTTFVVPITSGNFEGDGQIAAGFLSGLQGYADTLRAAIPADMVVWSRPTTTRAGSISSVVGAQIPDKVSWLRTRRT